MIISDKQRESYTRLKREGEIYGEGTVTQSKLNNEIYFKLSKEAKIVAIAKDGSVTIHHGNKE